MKKLLIYKASAGSGKTHMLTQEYLKLAFQHPEKYKNILAVTFTNKAADEMKERILKELNNLYVNGNQSEHYNTISKTYPTWSENKIKEQAHTIRTNILHNYSLFSVSTIDSFVQKVIRSFSYEIGVHSGYKVELETDKVLSDLTEILYKQIDSNPNLLEWLIKYAEYKMDDGKNWDFRSEIHELGKEIFKERFQFFAKELSEKGNIHQVLKDFYKELISIRNSFKNKMQNIGLQAIKVIENTGIQTDSLGQKFKFICNYLCKKLVKPSTHNDFEPNKTVLEALESIENWYAKKANYQIISQIESVHSPLTECIYNAVSEYNKNFENYLNAIVTLANYHAFGLLNEISNLLPKYRDENNLLLISDTTLLLKEIIGDNDAPFIYEKIGNRYQNILIDEFQDTSGFQWENFKPLIINSIAEGMQNLIVGDVKQSIYRWRGGDWKLLLQTVEEQIGSQNIENQTLDTNWRSRKNIIDFNNSLFKIAPELASYEFSGATSQEGLQNANEYSYMLLKAYSDGYQLLPKEKEKKGGRVKIKFYAVEKSIDMTKAWHREMQDDLAESIDFLLKNKNYTPTDIAILVRKNSEAREVTHQLLQYLSSNPSAFQYDIISEESLLIAKSASVRLIISMLNCMFDNKQDIFLANLILEIENLKNNQSNSYDSIFQFNHAPDQKQDLLKKIENLKEITQQMSLFEQVEEIITAFGLNNYSEEHPYIRSFQDVILSFTKNKSSDLGNFLEWWEEEKFKFNIQLSDKQNAVKVLTIHKSKGLAFNVVIVPYVDWKLENTSTWTAPTLWAKTENELFKIFSYLPIKYQKILSQTQYKNDYFEEKLFQYMDSLNALYVALTRPYQELLLFMPFMEQRDKIQSVADLIYASIVQSSESQIVENKHYIALSPFYNAQTKEFILDMNYNEIDDAPYKKPDEISTILLQNYLSSSWKEKLSIKTHSDNYFIEKNEHRQEKINYGILMHEILSKIHFSNDLESAVQEILYTGKISVAERIFILNKLKQIVLHSEIKDFFTTKYQIKTEAEILTIEGEKKIPDRLLISENELIVLDFKFGSPRQEHIAQVQEYKNLLQSINEFKNKKIIGYLFYAEDLRLQSV